MIRVEKAHTEDIDSFAGFEQQEDTREYIIPYTIIEHVNRMNDPSLIYLRILSQEVIVGFFVLALEPDGVSVEFRRIVVTQKERGIGQLAVVEMEHFCRHELGRIRIWLDVFEDNSRAQHIYEKLGYKKYGEGLYQSKKLYLYQKSL